MALADAAMHAIHHYGYGAVALAVGLESIGVPFPGEATLIAAAVYAGKTGRLDIALVIAAAAAGAIVGDNIGFWIGREAGFRLLRRYGNYIRLTPPRLKLGRYLFRRHGGKVVFFGRFVSILRTFAALLAGANRMGWGHFLAYNAAGGIVWATLYGLGAYFLGTQLDRFVGPVGIGFGAAAAIAVIAAVVFLRRNEARLEEEAERVLADEPGHGGSYS
ncbi:MAG TPA: DedA family protein [Hyphomicrobiales bacterium]|nr:DedA family protein [Hyphomicrobiales bacterium]